MIVDTDVLIWGARGNQRAARLLEQNRGFRISMVTYAEILEGVRDRDEARGFQKALRIWAAAVLHVNESISQQVHGRGGASQHALEQAMQSLVLSPAAKQTLGLR